MPKADVSSVAYRVDEPCSKGLKGGTVCHVMSIVYDVAGRKTN